MEPVSRVSTRHPDVTFMQLSRLADKKNIGTYFGFDGEGFYLAGVTAGRMTKTNKIGFVGSRPVPSTLWAIKVHLCDIASGGVELAPFGPSVPEAVRKEVLGLKEKIKTGKLVVFQGPIKDSTGKLRLPAGQKPDIHWLSTMNFFVSGVDGSLPKN